MSRSLWLIACIVCCMAVVCVVGCGKADPLGRRPISGRVTLDGAPVAQGSISFEPQQAGGVSSGGVITDGTYTIPADKGLPVGKYRVMIFSSAGGQGLPPGAMPGDEIAEGGVATAAPKELVPAKYNVESKLAVEVGQEGPYEYDFDLVTETE